MSPLFDWRDLAGTSSDPANRYRPTDQRAVHREVLRLRAQGLRPRDIAEAFGMNESEVTALIERTV